MLKRFDVEEPSSSPTPKRRRESTSTSGSGESDDSEDEKTVKGKSEMLLSQLAMFPSENPDPDGGGSVAAANGKSKARIKKVLNSDLCKCTRKCHKKVNLKTVLNICLTFWSLSKGAQDCILWSMQNQQVGCADDDSGSECDSDAASSCSSSSSSSHQPINTWYIQGWANDVGARCF